MVAIVANLVEETSTSTGATNFVLDGAINARDTFNTAFGFGAPVDVFFYSILHNTLNEFEMGTGHLSDAVTLVRDTVLFSSNGGAAVIFSAGGKAVLCPIEAADFNAIVAKLATIETNAKDDQTDAEIKTAYENNPDTNEFSDAEQTKLSNIETAATADQTDAEIKTAYENNPDTNEFSDAEQTNLANQSGTNTGDEPDASLTVKGIIELSTTTELNAGSSGLLAVSPSAMLNSDYTKTTQVAEWTRSQNFNQTELTDGATIAWDVEVNQVCFVTLGGNRTMGLPTNPLAGMFIGVTVVQDATGTRTLAWNTVFKFAGGVVPVLTTAALAVDLFVFWYDGTNWREAGRQLDIK